MKVKIHWTIIRRIGWGIVILASLLIATLIIIGLIMHEPRPEGKAGPEAEALAHKMLNAVNDSAWNEVETISWDFGGRYQHEWNKKDMTDRVRWGNNEVFINLTSKEGQAWVDGEEVFDKKRDKLLNKAWERWVNDAFWLNPVVKVFDEGVTRSIVKLEDGSDGLLVSYSSGGVTPGDAYLWELYENFRPKSWRMWVKIIPVGGLRFSWEDWIQTKEGAWISTKHEGPFTLRLKDVRSTM
ncbi:MAG: hypothetical protein R3B47_10345 [Bacteroidia bacterium]